MPINLFTASGNIGKDCEQRVTQNGKYVASFSLPVKQGFGDHEKVSWVTCKLLGAKAEKLPQYLTKGTKVTVSGEFVLEEWEKDGVTNKMACIIVRDLDFGGNAEGQQRPQQQQGWGQPHQPQKAPQQPQHGYTEPPMDFDQDIPF